MDNVLQILFDNRLSVEKPNDYNHQAFIEDPSYNRPALTYLDLDARIQTLSYLDLWNNCWKIYNKLLDKLQIHWIKVSDDIKENDKRKILMKIRPPLVIYGDCQQWTICFMIVANMLQLPFYFIDDQQCLLKLKQKLIKFLKYFITPRNRHQELLKILGKKFEIVENIFENHILLYDNQKIIVDNANVHNKDTELNISYIINTSGTTSGSSNSESKLSLKTIFVPHQAILSNVLDFQQEFNLTTSDVLLICSPFTFDPSICDILLGLSKYCHCILMDNSLKNIPEKFLKVIDRFNVTYMTITPSLWYRISHQLKFCFLNKSISLRYVNFGGEMCPTYKELEPFFSCKQQNNEIKFHNFYGLSEMSVWASMFELTSSNQNDDQIKNNDHVPIMGRPLLNTKVYLNEDQEIIIESSTRKCLIHDELKNQWTFNSKLFTNDVGEQIDSSLYFIKRKDFNDFIKLNGKKIYPNLIKYSILKEFGSTTISDMRQISFHVENCHVQPGKWRNLSLIEIILIISFHKSSQDSLEPIKQEIFNFLIKQDSNFNKIGLRLHLIDSSQLMLNPNGKLDFRKIQQNIDPYTTPLSKQELSIKEITETLEQILMEKFPNFQKEINLKNQGLDSITALELAIKLENEFGLDGQHLYEMLFNDSFLDIVKRIHEMINDQQVDNLYETCKKFKSQQSESSLLPQSLLKASVPIKPMTIEIIHEWSYFMEQCVDASPLIVTVTDQKKNNTTKTILICASHSGLICAFDLSTKSLDDGTSDGLSYSLLWSQRISSRIESSPVASSDGHLTFIADYTGYLRVFQTLSGRLKWYYRTGAEIKCSPLICDTVSSQMVLCGSFDRFIYCWNQCDGQLQWKNNIDDAAIFSSPVQWFDEILNEWFAIVATLSGTIACCHINSGGLIRWKQSYSNKPIFSTPKIHQKLGLLIVGITDSRIIAVSVQNGELEWELTLKDCPIFSSPCIIINETDDYQFPIVIGTNGKCIVCVQMNSNKPIWIFHTESNIYADVIVLQPNLLLSIETNGKLHLIDVRNGTDLLKEKFKFPAEVFSTPKIIIDDDSNIRKLFIGCRDSNLHCLKIIINES